MNDKKKKLAAIAAVTHYIRTQQEQAAYIQSQQAAESQVQTVQTVETVVTLKLMSMWGVSGRQQQMQVRNMVQMKAFHR